MLYRIIQICANCLCSSVKLGRNATSEDCTITEANATGGRVKSEERAKRHERRKNPPNITIQVPRDLDILEAVYTHRVLTQYQLQRLFFPSKDRTQQRLRLLYDHAYLDRRFQPQRVGETGRTPNL